MDALIAELLVFKRRHRGVISNSDWYIAHIPAYLRGELREPCRSGETTIHIDPVGMVRRCPDFPSAASMLEKMPIWRSMPRIMLRV